MKSRRSAVIGGLAGIVFGLLVAGYSVWRIGLAERTRAALEARKRTLLTALAVRAKSAARSTESPSTRVPSPKPKFSPEELARLNANLRRLHQQFWKSLFLQEYAGFFRSLHLSAVQVEQIANIWARGRMASGDYVAAKLKNLPPNSNTPEAIAANAGLEDVHDNTNQELRTALGDAGYEQFQAYQKELSVRVITSQMVNAPAAAGSPIDPVQAETLNRIFIAGATNDQGRINPNALNWDAAWAQAQPLLDPVQQDALKSVRETGQLWQKIGRIRRSADQSANSQGAH